MTDEPSVDILISYKSEDRPIAERFATALSAAGWVVWWDHHIVAGDAYRKVIAQKLAVAKCVVVLWSKRSVESDFVLDEAGRAQRRGVLIPVRIDPVDIPLGFGQQDYTDVIDWNGEETHAGFQELCRSIQGRLATQPLRKPSVVQPRSLFNRVKSRTAFIVAGLAAAVIIATLWLWPERTALDPAPIAVQLAIGSQVIASGFVLPSGYIVTPCHVVNEIENEIIIRGAGRWDGPARVRERRCEKDLALIESVHGPLLPNPTVVRFAGSLSSGDTIERYRGVSDRTPGKVIAPQESLSYLGGDAPAMNLLVTTNVSAGGDSGAPVLDGEGRIVGMLVAGDGSTKSFAIPIETIRETFINAFTP